MTWTLIVWSVLAAAWLARIGWILAQDAAAELGYISVGVGVALASFGVWFVGFVVLSLIWMMTRPQRRD